MQSVELIQRRSRQNAGQRRWQIQKTSQMEGISTLTVALAGFGLGSIPLLETWDRIRYLRISQFILLSVALSIAVETFFRRKRALILPFSVGLFVLWALWAGATILLMPSSESLPALRYLYVAKTTVLVVVFANVVHNRRQLLLILFLLVLSVPIVLALNYGGLQEVRQSNVLESRLAGTIASANEFALYTVIAVWISLAFFFTTKHLVRITSLLCACFASVLTTFTGSRQGMLGLLAVMPLFYLYYFRRRSKSVYSRVATFALTLLLTLGAIFVIIHSPFGYRFEDALSGAGGVNERIEYHKAGLRMWLSRPITGLGFEQFRFQAADYYDSTSSNYGQYSHSTFIALLSCMGTVGFLLYLASILRLYVELYRASTRAISNIDTTILRLAMGFILLLGMFHFSTVVFFSRLTWLLLALLAGYAHRLSHQDQQSSFLPIKYL